MLLMMKDDQGFTSLPSAEELTPLSQILVSPELASAFSITFEAPKTQADVLRASEATVSTARHRAYSETLEPLLGSKHHPLKANSSTSDSDKIYLPKAQNDQRATVDIEDRDGQTELVMEETDTAQVDAATISFPATSCRQGSRGSTRHEGGVKQIDKDKGDKGDAGGTAEKAKATQEAVVAFPAIKSRFANRGNSIHEGGVRGDGGDCKGSVDEKRKRPYPETADSEEGADSEGNQENSGEDSSARASKKPRLVWTHELHKRFVDAVAHLGIKNAVPKTIMQLMNVEGLTRENVASHLQKYRLYLKRSQDTSLEGVAPSDPLFASTPIPPSLVSATHYLPFPPMGPMGAMTIGTPVLPPGGYGGFEHHPYGVIARAAAQGMAAIEQSQQTTDNRTQDEQKEEEEEIIEHTCEEEEEFEEEEATTSRPRRGRKSPICFRREFEYFVDTLVTYKEAI